MAGMLPGVECARRRRFRQKTECDDSPYMATRGPTRKSSFCFYMGNNKSSLPSISSLSRSIKNEANEDERLDELARVAKMKLDERLKDIKKSEAARPSIRAQRGSNEGEMPKHGGWRRFRWGKRKEEEEECAICLESFTSGQSLVELPCPHRFHSICLAPWLNSNPHCPCCRMLILSSQSPP